MYGVFWIEFRDGVSGKWRRYGSGDYMPPCGCEIVGSRGIQWAVDCEFGELNDAIDAVVAWGKKRPKARLRIMNEDDGQVYWENGHPVETFDISTDSPITAGGTTLSYEEKKPLHVPTDALITRLEERAKEEQDRREAAEKAVADKRSELTEAIMALSEDELTNVLSQFVNTSAKFYEEAKKEKKFVSPESVRTPIESALEKQIRVLKMASDKEIEVTPDEEIYQLL